MNDLHTMNAIQYNEYYFGFGSLLCIISIKRLPIITPITCLPTMIIEWCLKVFTTADWITAIKMIDWDSLTTCGPTAKKLEYAMTLNCFYESNEFTNLSLWIFIKPLLIFRWKIFFMANNLIKQVNQFLLIVELTYETIPTWRRALYTVTPFKI